MRLRPISIIQYQNVSPRPELNRLWLSLEAFKKQLEYLSKNNFQVLGLGDAINYMERKKEVGKLRPISITFDNGFMDFYEYVLPVLAEYSCPATVLVSPPKVGHHVTMAGEKVYYVTWSLLKDLSKAGITIGAYEDQTWNINDISESTLLDHIRRYRETLESKLGIKVLYFGVKEGVPNPRIRDFLISEGYRAFLTQCPTNTKADLYAIGRIQVDDDDFNIFLTKISRTYLFFKDRKSWKYIRDYSLDKAAHKLSESYDKIRKRKSH
ncbi:MAG: polysaccharide deacetylase family protein [Deltaproteobacteria bacterium]|nr:polysaccharide deacetylase family protein [Deltaproteobacteria bacterium]MBW2300719.1 polysaccharide deacetylase family protein [Deltaproteobacteria bacterium]